MYQMCDEEQLAAIKQENKEIKSLEHAIADLYELYELTYFMLKGIN